MEQVKQDPIEELQKDIKEAIMKLPLEQRVQLVALNSHLLTRLREDVKMQEEINEISEKYLKIQEPCLRSVNEIIAGERAPTVEELNRFKDQLTAEEIEKIGENLKAEAIPEYWWRVLKSCTRLERFIFEHDQPLLKKLIKIEHGFVEKHTTDFSLTFHFAPNDYFENSSITATFYVDEDEVVSKIVGTEIQWKEGKNITEKLVKKRKKNKKTGKHENITKAEEVDSFFNLFRTVGAEEDKNQSEEEKDITLMKLQERNQIAMFMRGEIIIHHLAYILGLRTGEEAGDLLADGDDLQAYDDEDEFEHAKVIERLKAKMGKK